MNEHNELYRAGKVEYELDINEFSYLSYEELLALRTGTVDLASNETEDGIPAEQDRRRSGRTVAPASYSWTTVAGVVRPVQDQKQCASCWAFAAIGALEGQMAILKGKYEKLSEQEIIECAKNTYTGALFGCNGGVHYGVYNHAKDYNGVTTQAVKPYKASTSSACNVATTRTTGSKTNSYYLLPYLDESAMKEYLFSKGPLYVTYHVSNDFFNYKSGVYTDKYGYCTSSTSNNHGVLLVGYGTQSGVDYWLLKNSWGKEELIERYDYNLKRYMIFFHRN